MRRTSFGLLGMLLLVASFAASETRQVQGASGYADAKFQDQWQQGEAITANFWGPITTAKDGRQEPYLDVPGGMRLVQYFDKGRMELRNGVVTNGLLAGEIVRGQVQVGDATFQAKDPPAIPIAGDSDNPGPTYAQLGTTAKDLLLGSPAQPGADHIVTVASNGTVKPGDTSLTGRAVLAGYDDATQHNIPGVFVDYRNKAGVPTIGLAISEPFGASVKVAGQQKAVLIQVFERRVLTYNPANDLAFQVEMGNIGQHYFQWRYTGAPVGGTVPSVTTQVQATTAVPTFTGQVPPAPATLVSGTLPPRLVAPISLPPSSAFPKPPYTGPIYKCSDFPSQAVAQAYLRLFPSDPSGLDPGKTGIACPSNPAPTDQTAVTR